MKKILFLFIAFFIVTTNFAIAKDEVTFLYLNGSNTSDQKAKNIFYSGVKRFHPIFKKTLEEDPFIQEKMLRGYKISNTPDYIYWGQMSKTETNSLVEEINFLSLTSPKAAQFIRRFMALLLHDAIWIGKMQHMVPVLDMLHEKVIEEYQNGNKVVLMGYSAGSFINYEYALTKLPIINIVDLVSLKGSAKYMDTVLELKPKPTCLEAIFRDELVSYGINQTVTINPNVENFRANLEKLEEYTKRYCTPSDAVIGIINYASPLRLFYSEFGDPSSKEGEMNAFMYKYFIENNIFWLTVNYADDPFGFPNTSNITMEQLQSKSNLQIDQGEGLFYDKSDITSHRTFLWAHTSYWNNNKRFSKNIVKAYNEGYGHFHKK